MIMNFSFVGVRGHGFVFRKKRNHEITLTEDKEHQAIYGESPSSSQGVHGSESVGSGEITISSGGTIMIRSGILSPPNETSKGAIELELS